MGRVGSIKADCYPCTVPASSGNNGVELAKALAEEGASVFGWDLEWNMNYNINRYSFQVEANGKVEKVLELNRKKGEPVLLIQFDNTEYRDAVLKSSRMLDARSSTNVRFRRPKVKDLKHVVNLVRRH